MAVTPIVILSVVIAFGVITAIGTLTLNIRVRMKNKKHKVFHSSDWTAKNDPDPKPYTSQWNDDEEKWLEETSNSDSETTIINDDASQTKPKVFNPETIKIDNHVNNVNM